MLFSYGSSGQQQINDNQKCRQIARDFDCHADAAVRRGAHRPMEHAQGFTWCQWMAPLGECLCHIVPTATMVGKFERNTQNTNKTQFLASNYGTFWSLVVYENFGTSNGPSTQLINATSFVLIWNTTIGAKELTDISSSYQTLSGDKSKKVVKWLQSRQKSWRIYAPLVVKLLNVTRSASTCRDQDLFLSFYATADT